METPTTTEPVIEREISLAEANNDQSPPQEPPAPKHEDVLDILKPKAEPKKWVIGVDPYQREYTQAPLSFIGKMQWFALVGDVLEKAMSGDNALSMNNLLSAPQGRDEALTMEDFRDADTFIQAVGKLLVYAPTFMQDSFCIWLGVPEYDRSTVKDIMQMPVAEGGLSDDDGLEMIEIFIDQNYEAIDGFFREKLAGLRDRVQARQKAAAESRSSRR